MYVIFAISKGNLGRANILSQNLLTGITQKPLERIIGSLYRIGKGIYKGTIILLTQYTDLARVNIHLILLFESTVCILLIYPIPNISGTGKKLNKFPELQSPQAR